MALSAPPAVLLLLLTGSVLTAAGAADRSVAGENPPAVTPAESVGVARMLPNRNIMVGIAGPDAQAQAVLILEPGDNNYQAMIDHLGGLQPGETKTIPPWPVAPAAPPTPPPAGQNSPPPSPQR